MWGPPQAQALVDYACKILIKAYISYLSLWMCFLMISLESNG